jgi:hypothetical protein
MFSFKSLSCSWEFVQEKILAGERRMGTIQLGIFKD